jgi:glycosyltransferase involved in cell wall biosynthesis
MRVLSVHNRYQQRGGEDVIFEAEAELLAAHGVEVERLEFDNRSIPTEQSRLDMLKLAATTVRSSEGVTRVRDAVRRFRPDVVHFHNTFPLVSPAAYGVARAEDAAVVQTVQNYRLVCPAATCFRDGAPCEDCLDKRLPWPGVLHACYRQSHAQSAVVAAMLVTHRALRTWQRNVDVFLAATEFSRERLVAGGLPADKVLVKPNFLVADVLQRTELASGFAFVGRLTPEKGVETLLQAWQRVTTSEPLRIAGSGPLDQSVADAAAGDERILARGHVDRSAILADMAASRALIFPSLWYEGFPMTIVEAFAVGLPVIASRLGAMAELIEDGVNGLLYAAGEAGELAERLTWALAHPAEVNAMGRRARAGFEARYTAERNFDLLMDVYEIALARARRAK